MKTPLFRFNFYPTTLQKTFSFQSAANYTFKYGVGKFEDKAMFWSFIRDYYLPSFFVSEQYLYHSFIINKFHVRLYDFECTNAVSTSNVSSIASLQNTYDNVQYIVCKIECQKEWDEGDFNLDQSKARNVRFQPLLRGMSRFFTLYPKCKQVVTTDPSIIKKASLADLLNLMQRSTRMPDGIVCGPSISGFEPHKDDKVQLDRLFAFKFDVECYYTLSDRLPNYKWLNEI